MSDDGTATDGESMESDRHETHRDLELEETPAAEDDLPLSFTPPEWRKQDGGEEEVRRNSTTKTNENSCENAAESQDQIRKPSLILHSTSSQQSWLLRLFESSVFNMSIAIQYLFNSKEPGVLTYLGKLLHF